MDRPASSTTTAHAELPANGLPSVALALLRSLGPGRIVALGLVALLLLGFFSFIVLRAMERPYTLLFAGLEPADARDLVARLDSMRIPYRLTPAGDTVLVPEDRAVALRMALAEEGLPRGGTIGNELFDRLSGLTTTDFLADVNLRRAVEGELARSVASLRPVRHARVHVVWPKRELFRRQGDRASAAVVVSLRGAQTLDRRQIAGIRHLVAGAIPGLRPELVSIVDDEGKLLARPETAERVGSALDELEEHRIAFEQRVGAKIRDLLERSVGTGRVEVEVAAEFDFDEVETTVERFDPESQVARSTQTIEQDDQRSSSEPNEPVGVSGNLPVEADRATAGTAKAEERSRRSEETSNYEISRTVTSQRRRAPVLRRMTVAVQVDAINRALPGEPPAYEARSADELTQLEQLVRSAGGIDDERGDVVSVVSRPFALIEEPAAEGDGYLGLGAGSLWRLGEILTLLVLGLAMIFLGVRPALRRLIPDLTGGQVQASRVSAALAIQPPSAVPSAERASGATGDVVAEVAPEDDGSAAKVQLRQVQGGVRSSLIDEVGQIVETQPEEAVRVIRSWLREP